MVPVSAIARSVADDAPGVSFVALTSGQYRLAEGVNSYTDSEGFCLDFQGVVAALDFPISSSMGGQNADGWFFTEDNIFRLDTSRRVIELKNRSVKLEDTDLRQAPFGLCASLEALSGWFDIQLQYDANGALITVDSRRKLPAIERLERQSRINDSIDEKIISIDSSLLATAKREDYAWFLMPAADIFINAGFDRSAMTGVNERLSWGAIAVGELAKMTSEALISSDETGDPNSLRLRLYRRQYAGDVFGIKPLTEAVFGDVSGQSNSLISGGGSGRGISLSTYPLFQADEFDRTTLRGDMPIGWDAELYRNGQLLTSAVNSSDGRYEFKNIPIVFGDNQFRIILYGPQGQRRIIDRNLNTSSFLVPRGKVYSRLSLYQQGYNLLDSGANHASRSRSPRLDADLRAGIGSNLTVGMGLNSYNDTEGRLWFGSMSAQTSIAGFGLDGEIATSSRGGWGGELYAQRRTSWGGVRMRAIKISGGFASERFSNSIDSRYEFATDANIRLGARRVVPVTATASLDRLTDGTSLLNIREQASYSIKDHWLSQTLTYQDQLGGPEPAQLSGTALHTMRYGNYSMRSSIEYEILPDARIVALAAAIDQALAESDRTWRWNADGRYDFTEHNATFGIGASRLFDKFSLNMRGHVNTKGDFGVGLELSFSIGRGNAGWRLSSHSLAQTGSVLARVFDDVNNDGVYDPGDRLLPGVKVHSDSAAYPNHTDERGLAVIDGVDTSRPANFTIDVNSLDDMDLVPAKVMNAIFARNGRMGAIDVPLVVSGSVDGEVVLSNAGYEKALGGVNLNLINSRGDVVGRARSEFDGFYIFENVPVGSYQIAVDSVQALQMVAHVPQVRQVTVTRKNPFPSGIRLRLSEKSDQPRVVMLPIFDDDMIDQSVLAAAAEPEPKLAGQNVEDSNKNLQNTSQTRHHQIVLQALFGDEIMDLPIPVPQPIPEGPRQKIAILGPRFDNELAADLSQRSRSHARKADYAGAPTI